MAINRVQTLSLIKLNTFSRINSSVLGSSTLAMCLNKAVREAARTRGLGEQGTKRGALKRESKPGSDNPCNSRSACDLPFLNPSLH